MPDFVINSLHPEATADGSVYGPGEQFALSTGQANLQFNIDRITAGVFVPVDPDNPVITVVPPYSGLKGFVFHGNNPDAARPHGFASVEWMGYVEPTNALVQDTLVLRSVIS